MQETQVWFLAWEDPLEEEMATHSKYCLENPTNREPRQAIVHGVAKSSIWIGNWTYMHKLF